MSNTWEYRFAFRAEERGDVPPEFRTAYDRLVASNGRPSFGLFTPPIKERTFLASLWIPPKLVLVFRENITVLSLDSRSNQLYAFELSREDFLGFGLGEFLLNCWLTLYSGNSADGKIQVQFPSRAGQHYAELCRLLLNWTSPLLIPVRPQTHPSSEIAGLPAKFASFLKTHPELAVGSQFFFQPAVEVGKKRRDSFCNLLLAITSNGIIALGDRYRGGRSELGIEMAYFPLACFRSAEWIEPDNCAAATLQLSLRGKNSQLKITWPVFAGLKPYALLWISEVNEIVEALGREKPMTIGLAPKEDGRGAESSFAMGRDESRAGTKRD